MRHSHSLKFLFGLFLCGSALTAIPQTALAQGAPVDFEADSLVHDEKTQTVTAEGDVELSQSGRILKAEKIIYNLATDTAVAEGDVVFVDDNGDVHFAESVNLNEQMTKGLVEGMRTVMHDESRLWADKARRDGDIFTLEDARYTACAPCEKNPDKTPPWQIKAKKVTLDQEENMVSYQSARLEVGGAPVFYAPYFSHPDGTVERKSGFLTPEFGWNSELGGVADVAYFMDIAQNTDATVGVMMTTQEGPALKGQVRHRTKSARIQLDGSVAYSDYTDSTGGRNIAKEDEWRGHFFVDGLWNMNDKWRSGVNLKLTSDDQYLRQYDITSLDTLENEVYVERFDNRNYADVRFISFQDLRINRSNVDQPDILPTATMSFVGKPNQTFGGRWAWDSSFLGLNRDGNGQDVARLSSTVSWERRWVSNMGLVTTTYAGLRGDVYQSNDRDVAKKNPAESSSETDGRVIPTAHVHVEYPVQKPVGKGYVRLSPQASLTMTKDVDNDSSIPNEDSNDTRLEVNNLFESNRFAGLDRVEDRSHVTYGMRAGLYEFDGDRFEVFFGQSMRLKEDDNPFQAGSGLEDAESDFVGKVAATIDGPVHVDAYYKTQFDGRDFASELHEVDAILTYGRYRLEPRYFYARGVPGTDFPLSREQINLGASVDIDDQWRLIGDTIYDLGDDDPGLRRAGVGVEYSHQCYNVRVSAERDLTNRSSGSRETSVFVRVGLKNLGQVETSAYSRSNIDD